MILGACHDAQEEQMTTETLDASFEHGAFRLVQPPSIPDCAERRGYPRLNHPRTR